jgi:hypothetical protein
MTETGFGQRYGVQGELETPMVAAHLSVPFVSWTRTRQLMNVSSICGISVRASTWQLPGSQSESVRR